MSDLPWHPKITPYRLAVLAMTICLGTAKAISTQMGSVFIPTTFEWISGTVIFLMLFIISPYDSEEDAPWYLSWLFEPDCMDVIWHLLAICLSVPRPRYLSRQRIQTIPFNTRRPPITIYRILVSFSVLAFGILKAAFGYLGASTAATWTDWTLGVAATSIFYCLGLYEKSSSNLWPSFFADDQQRHLYTFGTAASYAAGIALSSSWILRCKNILMRIWLDTTITSSKPDPRHPILDRAFLIAMKCFLLEGIIVAIAFGVMCLVVILGSAGISIISWAATIRAVRTRISSNSLPSFSGDQPFFFSTIIPRRYITHITTTGRVCIHIIIHLCGLAGCLTVSFLITGVVTVVYDAFKVINNIFVMIVFGMLGAYITTMAGMLWLFDFIIVISMVTPLFMYRDARQFHSSLISP
ncbi:hypothetical protein GALMADRAFT_1258638 [Galerina marginata CBS 339.88]|uniref:Uncharacterized protein n=1 Tax=Galerina marginata (strain CBS 339.88) TaxID=685588 RepID=A0A067T8D2_GALM3|nr:hypothetical protein GALMADRAFT_1258638 [Galerina marginata CBS 339.88]